MLKLYLVKELLKWVFRRRVKMSNGETYEVVESKWGSRKWIAYCFTVAAVIAGMILKVIDPKDGFNLIYKLSTAYFIVQGSVDAITGKGLIGSLVKKITG